jgi:acyl-CoA dehydrogenase
VDFTIEPRVAELRDRVRAFIDDVVIPDEPSVDPHGYPAPELLTRQRAAAKAAGIFAPHVGTAYGGLGLDVRAQTVVFEEAGRSLFGPLALNCSAPDEGNMHLLEKVASTEQKERYLRPLAAGAIRSAFAMTEKAPGAGSDPSMLQTHAERRGNRWVINGDKWFITGADGAAFLIAMVRTGEKIDRADGATMLLVDAGAPGLTIDRETPSLDHFAIGGHCEVHFRNVEVGDDAVLGEVGKGYVYAQVRLGPARLTHCMRWLGVAVRAQEIALAYAVERTSFGRTLAEHGAVQNMLADNAIDIEAARQLTRYAAWTLDSGQPGRNETSLAKVFVAEATGRTIDRALQICGSSGVAGLRPLERFYREIRAFRIYDGPSEVHRMALAERLVRNVRAQRRA